MEIPHGTRILAALDKAGGKTRNAAGVCGDAGVVAADAADEVQNGTCVNGVKAQCGVDALCVDEGEIYAVNHGTEVFTHDAAGGVQAPDTAGGCGGSNDTTGLVPARNAAHGSQGTDFAAEGAVRNKAAVQPNQAADHAVIPDGGNRAADVQVMYIRLLPGFKEEAAWRLSRAEAEVVNGVPPAVKLAVEDGNGVKRRRREGQVAFQYDLLPVRPGVEGAILRKPHQLLYGMDMDHAVLLGKGKGTKRKDQCRQKKQGDHDGYAFRHVHCPPLRDLLRRTPRLPDPVSVPGAARTVPIRRLCCRVPLSCPTAAGHSPHRQWCRGRCR